MRVLVDTHILVWSLQDSERLTESMREFLLGADEVLVSSASVWEVAIKCSIGKMPFDRDALTTAIADSGFRELPVRARHAAAVASLPMHHRDPFDRLLIAQAMTEPLRLVTTDAALKRYSDLVTLIA